MDEVAQSANDAAPQGCESDFGRLVSGENLRRILRQTPQQRLDILCATLRDAEKRGMLPYRDRVAHQKHLEWLIQRTSSKS